LVAEHCVSVSFLFEIILARLFLGDEHKALAYLSLEFGLTGTPGAILL